MSSISRRTFVRGLAAGGALVGLHSIGLFAQGTRRPQEVLRGTSFDLSIGEAPMNFTGSTEDRASDQRIDSRARCCGGAKATP